MSTGNNITATTTYNDTIQNTITSLTSNYPASTTYDDCGIVTNTTTKYPFTWTDTGTAPMGIQVGTATNGWSFTYNELINYEKEKEKNMNNEFNFGAYNNQNLRLSPYGMAIKNKEGKWVSYNKDNGQIIDVDIINIGLDCSKIFFKIPKPVSSVNSGDIVLHNNTPVFVEEVKDKRFVVINPYEGTELTILPATSPFGYNYVNVIVSLTEFFGPATEDNPFGNLLPLILSGNNNNNLLLPYLLMKGSDFHNIDPMLLLACGGNNNLPLFLMMQNYNKDKETKDIKIKKED